MLRLTYIRPQVQFLEIEILGLQEVFGLIIILPLAGPFLLISFVLLHKLLEGRLGAVELIGFGLCSISFLGIFGDLEAGVGFVGSDDAL